MRTRRAAPRRGLAALYIECNAQFWGGQLPAPIKIGLYGPAAVWVRRVPARLRVEQNGRGYVGGLRCRTRRGVVLNARGRFIPPGEFLPARIHVLSVLDRTLERRVLLHEMCHFSVFLAGPEEMTHGPRFVAELRRIGALGEPWAIEEAARYDAARQLSTPGDK